MNRRGTSLVETLIAGVLVALMVSFVAGGLWTWSRTQKRLELTASIQAALEDRLERCITLPLHLRPSPGVYKTGQSGLSLDLERILDGSVSRKMKIEFQLEVKARSLFYEDYFFEGSEKIEFIDFRRFKLSGKIGKLELELVTFR